MMSSIIDLGDALADGPALLHLPHLTPEEFWDFCQRNPDMRAERTREGDLVLMAPSDSETDNSNSELLVDLGIWNRGLPSPGRVFGPSAGFTLPNGAQRSPDASWIAFERWEALSPEERTKFAQICPDFVVEIMSPSDRLKPTQSKIDEYMANSARLGWLIDRKNRRVHVYRPDQEIQILDAPSELSAAPELPGLVVSMSRIF